MSKFSKLGLRRAAGAVAVAAVAAIGAASMGAGHAEAAPLANGYKNAGGAQIWRTGESAYATPTVANNPAQRQASLSGTYTAKLAAPLNGNIAVKYIIGCQVNVSGLTLGLGGSFDISPAIGGSATLSLPLAPGQVAVASITDKDIKAGGTGSIQIQDFTLILPNCGGYASARSAVQVVAANGYNTDGGTVNGTGNYIQSTLYGQPFSLN
ncbi:MspA family porin [Gordonia sp. NPDC003425]